MGIIRGEDRAARQEHLAAERRERAQRRQGALAELERRLPHIADEIANNAREWLRLTGTAKVGVALIPWSLWAIRDDPSALDMILNEMRRREPRAAAVRFGDDYESRGETTMKVIVSFDPPLV